MADGLQIGIVVFPRVTQLDFTGPLQVFSSVPGAKVHLIWKRIEPVPSDSVMAITPTTTFADCPQLDVICVPGGIGTDDMVNDEEMLAFLRKQAEGAKYVTSVCTGSLVLGAAGLLEGYRATTHWSAMEALAPFGAITDQDPRLRRPQPRHRRRRHRRHRFRADAGLDHGRSQDGGSDPAPARIQSRPALQCRLAGDGAGGSACTDAGADGADAAAPHGELSPRRRATARAQLAPLSAATKKKAAWLPRRPFLSHGCPTLTGDFRTSAPGAYLLAASYSGAAAYRDSRELEPEPYAMVSHLRKMGSIEPH